ncbi:two-component system, chemotaxis family, CheB/CheR fusion protein [Methylomagnum ishizawai]|uniref:protein-glutamate O-methyltransferase n=1 Tax=Methylomagnum ishizawai TaxID=1760988 RepID=A0A1Y6D682_9GAMM|nr:chemotaxis protein CheB [Methylomagnum ishizawai]SMF95874.1 two-component system, chemotaxis family, CheB/CheR fusion protein [Methylomagnum ishizawai]
MAKRKNPDKANPQAAIEDGGETLPAAGGDAQDFPIVGIGASAGGLEALEQFLSHVPAGSGMAYIIIQHLDPTRQGIMPELLGRMTPMRATQAEDGMEVAPDCVYVIPPNKDLSILGNVLCLLDPVEARGLRLPIDFFLRALAAERRERAAAVILSGMGSDGTLGLKAVKEKAGLVLVQDPADAKFDGMPRSAIDTGLADIVAPAEALPARLIAALHHPPPLPLPIQGNLTPLESATRSALDQVVILLRVRTGQDFSLYKKSTVYRRIERRMGVHQIDRIATYVRFLQENPGEVNLLFKELLIGVTSFFRDKAAWAYLREEALPTLLVEHPEGRTLRAWVPACSTGEEAYSLAITFREAQEQADPKGRHRLQVFATDLDQDAITKARQGFYPSNIVADVETERLERFFTSDQGGYRVDKEIRDMVIFAPQNLLSDPPFTKLDFLSCRNLLIYLEAELQKKLFPLFHYSLNPGGILFLGSAETIGGFTDLFAPLDGKHRCYRSLGGTRVAAAFPPTSLSVLPGRGVGEPGPKEVVNIQELMDRLILRQFAPAAVLVNEKGDITYVSGRTGKYLEPAAGKANWNIHAMAREGVRHAVATALPQALRQGRNVDIDHLVVATEGGPRHFALGVQPIDAPPELRGMALVVFQDTPTSLPAPPAEAGPPPRARNKRMAELEAETTRLLEENRALRESMQASHEELHSANEELQSMNEEMQSTNEELTTSKEELQSLNEELQTVNAELQAKVDDLSHANNDLKNLLNSTDIATLFLDGRLRIRRFATPATRLFKLIPGDVGRPLSDIVSELDYPEFHTDIQEVLRTLVFSEKAIPTRDGRWHTVRIMPYRTLDNVIDGVVITFVDITASKVLEAELRQSRTQAS